MFYAFDYLPHHPHTSTERYHDTRIQPGRIRHALLLAQNYHLIHHLWVSVPWFRYRTAFTHVEDGLRAKGATIDG
jgi:beta-carotene hydroxylase